MPLFIHPSSAPYQAPVAQFKRKIEQNLSVFVFVLFLICILEIYIGRHLWLTKCVPIKMKKVQSLQSGNIFNTTI